MTQSRRDSDLLHLKAIMNDTTMTKSEDKKTYTYYPRALDIIWGLDRRYWRISDEKVKKEESVAELMQVNWLEVRGKRDEDVEIGKTYQISFEISMEAHAFGWEGLGLYILAKIGKKGAYSFAVVHPAKENKNGKDKFIIPSQEPFKITVQPVDPADLTIYFGLYEVSTGAWKGGLKIYKAIVQQV